MKKNKLVIFIVTLVMCFFSFNIALADNIFDSKTVSEVYKLSEDDSSFDIPFVRFSDQRIEIDKSISQMGLFMTNSSLEVKEPLTGIQGFYSNDTVRLNASTEYPIIFTTGNVVINDVVENTAIVFCTGTITIGENADIKQNLICYSDKVEINANVSGNILGIANTLNINNTVQGKVKMQVESVNCSENAKVEKGIFLKTTNTSLTVDENVGETQIEVESSETKTTVKQYLLKIFTAAIGNIVIFLLILIFAKKERLEKLSDKLQNSRVVLKNGALSYLALLAMICFGIVLLIPIARLGFVFLLFSACVMTIITILKNVIFGTFVVELVSKKYNEAKIKPNNILTAIMLFIILELLETIPFVGEVIKFVTFLISLGIIVTLIRKNNNKENNEVKQEVIEAK